MVNKLLKQIEQFEYISFDMFDTLVLRNVCKPSDIFKIVDSVLNERKFCFNGFPEKRISAEKQAVGRLDGRSQEVTIDEIYECLIPDDERLRYKIKEIEKGTEEKYCVPNAEFTPVLEFCRSNNKKIIITTDMYLDKVTIERILSKCQINYDYLFLSSELGIRKSRGDLFDYILNSLHINKNQIIHIGDNTKSDFVRPFTMGIKAIHYKGKTYSQECEINSSISSAMIINNDDEKKSIYWNEGYKSLGPLLFGFCQWLHTKIKDGNFKQLLFLSRDGFVIQKAYNLLYSSEKSEYIFCSRRSLTVPQISNASNFREVVDIIAYIKREETVVTLLHKLGIDDEEFVDEIKKKYGEALYRDKLINEEYKGLFEKVSPKMKSNSRKEFDLASQYFESVINENKVAIVDIGWYGTMQHNLQLLLNEMGFEGKIYGYYIGFLSGKYDDIAAQGYIFDNRKTDNVCDPNILFGFNGLIETFFTANHGSVKKYISKDNQICPVFEEWEKDNWVAVSEMHEGALKFIDDYSNYNLKESQLSTVAAWENMSSLLQRPSKKQLAYFGKLAFFDTYVEPLNKYRGMKTYIKAPMIFKKDFLESNWKLGFIQSMFKGFFKPEKIYMLLNELKG